MLLTDLLGTFGFRCLVYFGVFQQVSILTLHTGKKVNVNTWSFFAFFLCNAPKGLL